MLARLAQDISGCNGCTFGEAQGSIEGPFPMLVDQLRYKVIDSVRYCE